jgi:hypothetical protein
MVLAGGEWSCNGTGIIYAVRGRKIVRSSEEVISQLIIWKTSHFKDKNNCKGLHKSNSVCKEATVADITRQLYAS